jgi:poly-gamma-glutamate synthesis protein (capsule biosynthesis protein)
MPEINEAYENRSVPSPGPVSDNYPNSAPITAPDGINAVAPNIPPKPSIIKETDDLDFLLQESKPAPPVIFHLNHTVPQALKGKECSVKVIAVGDVLIHGSLRNYAHQDDGTYDFSDNFEYVRSIFSQGDLVIANLENPLAGDDRGLTGYPLFNAPQKLATDLKEAGFTTVLLANNHSLDKSWNGLVATVETVNEAGLEYSGAYTDEDDKSRRLVSVFNGIKIGLLSYTYGLNGFAGPKKGEEYRLSLINLDLIFSDLRLAREQGADFVIVSLHFGSEYPRKPHKEQTKLVEAILNGLPEEGLAGPDLILGHHPHVVQPFYQRSGFPGTPGQAVLFSLGNFMSGQPFPYTYIGLIFEAELTIKADGTRVMGPFKFTPTYCYRKPNGKTRGFTKVIPLQIAAQSPESVGLTKSDGDRLKKLYEEMEKHIWSMTPTPVQDGTVQADDPQNDVRGK